MTTAQVVASAERGKAYAATIRDYSRGVRARFPIAAKHIANKHGKADAIEWVASTSGVDQNEAASFVNVACMQRDLPLYTSLGYGR